MLSSLSYIFRKVLSNCYSTRLFTLSFLPHALSVTVIVKLPHNGPNTMLVVHEQAQLHASRDHNQHSSGCPRYFLWMDGWMNGVLGHLCTVKAELGRGQPGLMR